MEKPCTRTNPCGVCLKILGKFGEFQSQHHATTFALVDSKSRAPRNGSGSSGFPPAAAKAQPVAPSVSDFVAFLSSIFLHFPFMFPSCWLIFGEKRQRLNVGGRVEAPPEAAVQPQAWQNQQSPPQQVFQGQQPWQQGRVRSQSDSGSSCDAPELNEKPKRVKVSGAGAATWSAASLSVAALAVVSVAAVSYGFLGQHSIDRSAAGGAKSPRSPEPTDPRADDGNLPAGCEDIFDGSEFIEPIWHGSPPGTVADSDRFSFSRCCGTPQPPAWAPSGLPPLDLLPALDSGGRLAPILDTPEMRKCYDGYPSRCKDLCAGYCTGGATDAMIADGPSGVDTCHGPIGSTCDYSCEPFTDKKGEMTCERGNTVFTGGSCVTNDDQVLSDLYKLTNNNSTRGASWPSMYVCNPPGSKLNCREYIAPRPSEEAVANWHGGALVLEDGAAGRCERLVLLDLLQKLAPAYIINGAAVGNGLYKQLEDSKCNGMPVYQSHTPGADGFVLYTYMAFVGPGRPIGSTALAGWMVGDSSHLTTCDAAGHVLEADVGGMSTKVPGSLPSCSCNPTACGSAWREHGADGKFHAAPGVLAVPVGGER